MSKMKSLENTISDLENQKIKYTASNKSLEENMKL